jgi:phosphoglycolate phosphatase-like HAD superfamily hydrolase
MSRAIDTVVLDLDGTLVDSVYVHTVCWHAAFRDVGVEVASHALHRAVGMGSDRLVAHVAGDPVERAVGDDIRARHAHHLDQRFHDITPTPGASELVETLRAAGFRLVLASSGERGQAEAMLDLVEGAGSALEAVVAGADADRTKPDGDLVTAALGAIGADAGRAVLIGDTVWDARAASDAGTACIGVLTGGITEAELRDAGCREVYESAAHLVRELPGSALLGRGEP